jgi:hypothetical protein
MTKFFTVACAALLLAAPTVALADDAMKGDHMAMKPAAKAMICREAQAGEKGNAMMAGGHTSLMCKSVASMMHDGKIVGPDLSKALTTDQVNAAWQAWVSAQFAIPATPGGG